jgi:hypothetical protein
MQAHRRSFIRHPADIPLDIAEDGPHRRSATAVRTDRQVGERDGWPVSDCR